MAKETKTVAYSPTGSDLKHAVYCMGKGLIFLSLSRARDPGDCYYLTRTEYDKKPFVVHYFLKDFNLPATPNNRVEFTEREAYIKMFSIYKEFYMRNNNIQEEIIAETKILDDLKAEPKLKKEPKKKKAEKDWINFPLKQVDLFELIEICEKETALQ